MKNYSEYTDHELAVFLTEGDQFAFTEIFNRYKVILYKHAFRLLNNQEEANDVIQDVFIKLWQKKDALVFKVSLSSYLYTSVRNRIFDLISHQEVATKYVDSILSFMKTGDYIVDEQIRMKELTAIIEKEIAALPKKMREVFELSRQDELSYKQIGQQL